MSETVVGRVHSRTDEYDSHHMLPRGVRIYGQGVVLLDCLKLSSTMPSLHHSLHPALRTWFEGEPHTIMVGLDATGVNNVCMAISRSVTTPYTILDIPPAELATTLRKLGALRWPLIRGWDAFDVAFPRTESIRSATEWIKAMYDDVVNGHMSWYDPHVSVDEDGDIMFEWWNEDKALTVYVSAEGARYIKGWGLDAETDMEDGEDPTPEMRRELWAWLVD